MIEDDAKIGKQRYFCRVNYLETSPQKYLIVIGGPTASGKTAFAIRAALHWDTEILSADSRQFYREMRIGTAKPSADELSLVRHHFIDHLSIHDAYSVGDFERDALRVLAQIFRTRQVAVLAGGSGLYVRALCEGMDAFPPVPAEILAEVEQLYTTEGIAALQEALRLADPAYFAQVDTHNPARLIRALSVCRASGKPFSAFRKGAPAPRPFKPIYVQLEWPRAALYERIDHRVDDMIARGLEAEARQLYPWRHLAALQTVGYQELFDYFEGLVSLEQAIALIKQHTRNYAKRQLTWMRRYGQWTAFHPAQWEHFLDFVHREITKNAH